MTKFSKNKLENVAENSLYTTFTNSMTIEYSFEIFKRYIRGRKILELGPAEGLMTNMLKNIDEHLTVIEGSKIFAKKLKINFPNMRIINSLFEDVNLEEKFDTIVLGHVLEHVENPEKLLKQIKHWLNNDGLIMCAVPNANSIHRQAAVEMGLIKSVFQMSEKDIHHGHMRIYTPETLRSEFINSGYEIVHRGGYWLKPLNDALIEKSYTKEMLYAFMKLGEYYPDIAAESYIIAKKIQ